MTDKERMELDRRIARRRGQVLRALTYRHAAGVAGASAAVEFPPATPQEQGEQSRFQ